MRDFTAYMEIIYHGEKVDYVLNAGWDVEKKQYYMPSLLFYKNYGLIINQECIESWDNDTYVIETLYNKVLLSWTNDNTILDGESFAELVKINGGIVNDIPAIKELIDKGIELGFFSEHYNKKENGTE